MNKGITFLGTAGDAAVFGKQVRASGGIILKTEDNQFHINPGPGSLIQYRAVQANPRETNAILLSSQKVIDSNDANALIEAMTLDGLDKKGVLVMFASNQDLVTDYHKTLVERYIQIEKGMRLAINDVEIKIGFSSDKEACGFMFFAPEYVLGYIGHTGYREVLGTDYKDCNILIVNCKNPSGIEDANSLNVDDVKKIVKEAKPNLCIITGFGEKILSGDIIDEARSIQKETGIQTQAATDGLHVNPQNYSKGFRQQRLKTY